VFFSISSSFGDNLVKGRFSSQDTLEEQIDKCADEFLSSIMGFNSISESGESWSLIFYYPTSTASTPVKAH